MGKLRALVLASILAMIAGAVLLSGMASADHSSGGPPFIPGGDFRDMEMVSDSAGYVLHPNGRVEAFGGAEAVVNNVDFGFNIARAMSIRRPDNPNKNSGFVLSGWGTLHPWSTGNDSLPDPIVTGPYWPGWDIARDFIINGGQKNGFVLSGWGSLHPFSWKTNDLPDAIDQGPFWPGWDIARDIESDAGEETAPDGPGFILDGWGGVHPWSTTENVGVLPGPGGPFWQGWDIARDLEITPNSDGSKGWITSGWGSVHSFGGAGEVTGAPYWAGWDIVRDLETMGCNDGDDLSFLTLDGWGGRHASHDVAGCV